MDEARKDALRVDCDRSITIAFHGSTISSDGGLLAYRELDEAFGLTLMVDDVLTDLCTGSTVQHSLTALGVSQSTVGQQATMTLTMPGG